MNYNTSLFSQLLRIIARENFEHFAIQTGTSRHNKGYTPWDHFVSMLFCHFASAKSLHETVSGLTSLNG